jgi:hypothetical protein
MATVIIPSEHAITLTFEGRTVHTNRVQLVAARHMLRLHTVGIRNKVSPVTFLNRVFDTRKTAKFWQAYLADILA